MLIVLLLNSVSFTGVKLFLFPLTLSKYDTKSPSLLFKIRVAIEASPTKLFISMSLPPDFAKLPCLKVKAKALFTNQISSPSTKPGSGGFGTPPGGTRKTNFSTVIS